MKGSRLRVYWTGEKRWFKGVITAVNREEGRRIFQITYDDGDVKWHDLAEEFWLRLGGEKKAAATGAAAAAKPKPALAAKAAPKPKAATFRKAQPAKVADPDADEVATEASSVLTSIESTVSSSSSSGGEAAGSAAGSDSSVDGAPPPPLVTISDGAIELLPCGVVKIKNVVTPEVRECASPTGLAARPAARSASRGPLTSLTRARHSAPASSLADYLTHASSFARTHAGAAAAMGRSHVRRLRLPRRRGRIEPGREHVVHQDARSPGHPPTLQLLRGACVGVRVRGRAWACVCTCVHMCAHVSTAFVFVRSRDRAAPSRRHAQPPIGTENRKAGLKRAKTEQEQPPPMAVLCLADAIFQAMREHIEGCRHRGMPVNSVLEEGVSSGDDDEDEGEEEAFKEVPIADAPAWALKHGLVPKPRVGQPRERAAAPITAPDTALTPSPGTAPAISSAEACGAAAADRAADDGVAAPHGETAAGTAGPACGAGASSSSRGAGAGSLAAAAAVKKRRRPLLEKVKEHREIGIDEDPLVALVRQAEEDSRRLLWPRRPNFRSVLAIGYRGSDSFKWHTDLAGDEGWVCSISVGAKAIFEYLPTAAPSALRRARAKAQEDTVRVEIDSGDAILFNGGLVPHRVAGVDAKACEASPSLQAMMAPYVRLNLQVRVYGTSTAHGLQELLKRGYDYVR